MLRESLTDENDIHFGVSVTALQNTPEGVEVTFTDGRCGTYDAVVGADGVASNTRRLLFSTTGEYHHDAMLYYAMCSTQSLPEALRNEFV